MSAMEGGSTTALKRGATAMGMLLLASLAAGLLVPVYTDEVGWRLQLSRWVQDGWVDRAMSLTCGANTTAAPPWFLWPVRLFSSGATALIDGPLLVRGCGVALAMLGVAMLRAIVRAATTDLRRRALIELYGYSLLGLGVLPLLLVWQRPEQPLLLTLLAAVLIVVRTRGRARAREPVAAVLALLALAVVAMSYHPKALFYMPVFAVAMWCAGLGSATVRLRVAALLALAAMAWAGTHYWGNRFVCPLDPAIAALQNKENGTRLLFEAGWHDRLAMLPRLIGLAPPTRYIRIALPALDPMSQWLPRAPLSAGAVFAWRALGWLCWWATVATTVAALVQVARRPRAAPARLAVALTLIGCASVAAALQLVKNAYEAALYLPVLVIAAVCLLSALRVEPRWLPRLIAAIALGSALSQLAVLAIYAPLLWRGDATAYPAGQPYSVSPFGYPRAQIVAAGAKCGIAPDAPGVLVDDVTYFAFARGYRPVHRLGVLSGWNGSLGDPMAWLPAHGSAGAVLGCRYLPLAMRARATATGAFCCVSAR